MRVAIIGGGISGLSLGCYLKDKGIVFDIFEGEDEVGGKIKSIKKDGYIFEEGANGFLSVENTLNFIDKISASHLVQNSKDDSKIRYIYDDKLKKLPSSFYEFLKSDLLSFSSKVRLFLEPFMKAKKNTDDESVGEFTTRRLGIGITTNIVDPFLVGVYAGGESSLSIQACFPKLYEWEQNYGSIVKGLFKNKKKKVKHKKELTSFKGGLSTFILHMKDYLKDNIMKSHKIITNTKITKITKRNDRFYLNENHEGYDKVVLCTPSFVSSNLLSEYEDISNKLKQIHYSPIAVVSLGYNDIKPLKAFGFLTTQKSNQDILGVLYESSIYEGRAKKNSESFRVMIGGNRSPHLCDKTDTEIIQIAIDAIKDLLGIQKEPNITIIKKHKQAIPLYAINHKALVDDIFHSLKSQEPNIYLHNNAYRGISINDCILNSMKLSNIL